MVRYCSPGVEFMRFEGEYMTRDWEPLLQVKPETTRGSVFTYEQGAPASAAVLVLEPLPCSTVFHL